MTTDRRDNLLATCSSLEDKLQRFIVTVAFPNSGKRIVVATRLAASPPSRETRSVDADTIIVSIGYHPSVAIAELKKAIRGFLIDFIRNDPDMSYRIAPRYTRTNAGDMPQTTLPGREPFQMDESQKFVRLGVRVNGLPTEISLPRELAWKWHEAIGNAELDPGLLISLREEIRRTTEQQIDLPPRFHLFAKRER